MGDGERAGMKLDMNTLIHVFAVVIAVLIMLIGPMLLWWEDCHLRKREREHERERKMGKTVATPPPWPRF